MRLLQVLHVCIATISNTIFCILCYCQFAGIRLESSGLVWRQFEVLDFKVANFSWTCFGIFSFLLWWHSLKQLSLADLAVMPNPITSDNWPFNIPRLGFRVSSFSLIYPWLRCKLTVVSSVALAFVALSLKFHKCAFFKY